MKLGWLPHVRGRRPHVVDGVCFVSDDGRSIARPGGVGDVVSQDNA